MAYMLKNEQAIPVNSLGRYVTDLCRLRASTNISVRFATTLWDNYTVTANEEALRQLLCRLMDDAIRHTATGHVVLTVTDSVPAPNHGLTFAVSDTRGYRSAHQSSALRVTGNQYAPSALDTLASADADSPLSSCQYIARLLDGTLRLDPNYRRGLRLLFILPTKKP